MALLRVIESLLPYALAGAIALCSFLAILSTEYAGIRTALDRKRERRRSSEAEEPSE